MNMKSESLSEVHGSVGTRGKTGWRKLFAFVGPAYLVSVGYMDPGNWATDIAGGSQFGGAFGDLAAQLLGKEDSVDQLGRHVRARG